MKRPLRIGVGLLGVVLSQGLIVTGLYFIDQPPLSPSPLPALALLGAGFAIAMQWVIDPLVPDAGPRFVACLKVLTGLTFCIAGVWTLYALFTGPQGATPPI